MATAVRASAKHSASYQFSGRAKPKGLLGQSPLPERQQLRLPVPQFPSARDRQLRRKPSGIAPRICIRKVRLPA
jgi:hypothetical protein